jgi:Tol biopolymer transport system component
LWLGIAAGILMSLAVGGPLVAKPGAPLVGPLVAVGAAEQDRIILYDIGSGDKRILTFGNGWHQLWGFAPDGCRIVFTMSAGADLARLYTARLDGSDLRELVRSSEAGDWGIWEPAWSPDGKRIAFTWMRSGKTLPEGGRERSYRLAWVDAAGGEPNFYTTGDAHEPQWSPDGRWLAYVVYNKQQSDIWIVSADGQTQYKLTNFPGGNVRAPRWSSDSELLSFIYSPSPANDQFWMTANQSGAILTQLSSQSSLILDVTWFPDGTALLASARDFRGVPTNVLWRIPLLGNADTTAERYVADPALLSADFPRFSPDGRWLALRSAYSLALVDTRDQTWKLLDDQPLGNTPPVWSPAGFKGETAC